MSKTKLEGVADTLFIPLSARVEASRRFPEYFYDEKSLEFEESGVVKEINSKSTEYTMLASVSRYYQMDRMVQNFADKNVNGVVVCLGAGLETMNYRLKETGIHFYQVDFPKVIEMRKLALGVFQNETLIGADITDMVWTKQIDKTKPVLLVASGVFQYFKPEVVKKFIEDIKDNFSSAELIFDATDKKGIEYAEKYVKKTGNKDAMMYFYMDDIKKFCCDNNVKLITTKLFYTEARKMLKGLKLYTKIAMRVVDNKKRCEIFHLKI